MKDLNLSEREHVSGGYGTHPLIRMQTWVRLEVNKLEEAEAAKPTTSPTGRQTPRSTPSIGKMIRREA